MSRQLSGQITVTTAGTAVQGPNVEGSRFALKAHPTNTGSIWMGNDVNNTVSATTGFPLDPGESIEVFARNLNVLHFDAGVSGEMLCWYRVE